jgi:triphosphoribosyl-dephospho-CoA synthase
MIVEDFRISAKVSAVAITDPAYSLGQKIYYAVKATRDAVHCNTNLGILLLCGPLMQAMNHYQQNLSLRNNLATILQQTTIEDAEWVFKAIALASPGGLGESEQQDVNKVPEVTLTQAMQIASKKDRIAQQYTNNYKDIFEIMVLMYNRAFNRWGDQKWAVTAVFSGFLSQFPDSHIERKYGSQFTDFVFSKMKTLNDELMRAHRPEQTLAMLYDIDAEFKASGVNPGTTADLIVATMLTIELERLLTDLT